MNIQKLPSGSYRIKQMHKGKYYCITVDHKPSKKEATILLAEKFQDIEDKGSANTFETCAKEYINSKSNILSPSTINGYEKVLRQIDEEFKGKNINDITQLDIQKEVNRYADGRKAKTVANLHGFISAVLGLFRPNMKISTTLPQKVKFEPYTPTNDDIKNILKASKDNTKYHICFQLGVLSLRRSEVCALTLEDIDFDNNLLTINKALVINSNNELVIKPLTKTTDGMRTIPIPQSLADEIRQNGFIIDVQPHMLVKTLHDYQKELNIPLFRFHDLRHYFASYAHELGISDADILASGGWKSDYTMKRVYRHAMEEQQRKNQALLAEKLLS